MYSQEDQIKKWLGNLAGNFFNFFFVSPFQVQAAGCELAIIVHFAVKLLIRTHLLGDFISTDKYGAYWLLLVSVDILN